MATHRPSKNNAIKPCLLLLFIVTAAIVFIGVFFNGMTMKSYNQVTPASNYKIIQSNIPNQFGSNNNIQKSNEPPKQEEGIKIPTNLFTEGQDGKPIMFQKVDPNDKNCPINMELVEINKKLIA